MYCFVAASIAELASAMPSSAGGSLKSHFCIFWFILTFTVYQWSAVVSGTRYGSMVSFYAGWWNTLAWVFATISSGSVVAQQVVQVRSQHFFFWYKFMSDGIDVCPFPPCVYLSAMACICDLHCGDMVVLLRGCVCK